MRTDLTPETLKSFECLLRKSKSLAAGLPKALKHMEEESIKIAMAMKPGDILALSIGTGRIAKKTIFLVLGDDDSLFVDER